MSDVKYIQEKLKCYVDDCINQKKYSEAFGAIEFIKSFGSIDIDVLEDKISKFIQEGK